MKDELISLKTAKLAEKHVGREFGVHPKDIACVVTQSLLQKWLRDTHSIHIISKPFFDSQRGTTTYVADAIRIGDGRTSKSRIRGTFEEALEEGLFNALNLIKNE